MCNWAHFESAKYVHTLEEGACCLTLDEESGFSAAETLRTLCKNVRSLKVSDRF